MDNNLFNNLTGRSTLDDLYPEVIEAFEKLKYLAQTKDINLSICSSYRSYESQERIWNSKATGKRKLYTRTGELLDFSKLNKKELLESILTWSALPGASRHHWGTDFDIFDLNIKSREEVNLTIKECSEDFETLYTWLDKAITETDFTRPYSKDLGGVSVEPWHLSYSPISSKLQENYTLELFIKNIERSSFELKELVLENAEHIYKTYVQNTST
jgi:LAS superfamily LD-carboxypeptidase LdcB